MNKKFVDKHLLCVECKKDFLFSKDEQDFYVMKALELPKRCPVCRKRRKRFFANKRKKLLRDIRKSDGKESIEKENTNVSIKLDQSIAEELINSMKKIL